MFLRVGPRCRHTVESQGPMGVANGHVAAALMCVQRMISRRLGRISINLLHDGGGVEWQAQRTVRQGLASGRTIDSKVDQPGR